MATQSAKTRPATVGKGYQMLSVIGPTAGVDLRTSPTLLPPERARTLVNFSLQEPGALVVRKPYQQFSTSSLGAQRIQGGARVYLNTATPTPNSTSFTLVGYNGGIYNLSDSGGWSGPQLTGRSTAEYAIVSDRDLVAVFDGTAPIYKSTNGSSWTTFGIARPTSSAVISSLSTGGLSPGEYEINYTYKDRDLVFESNGSSQGSTLTLSASSGAINAVVTNSTTPGVDAIVVYARKVSAGETVLRKVSSQSQSAGVSSTFVITSTAWTTNDEIPTDHDTPPAVSFGVVWKNRWWARSATVTNRLHFTQLFAPQAWPALFYLDLPFEKGDLMKAIIPLGDVLVVFGTTRAFLIIGQTSLDFDVRPTVASQDGALGFRSAAVIENAIVHMGASGVYTFDGTSDKLLSFDLEPAIQDLVGNVSVGDLQKTAMVYHQKEKELRIAVARRFESGAVGEWVLDLNRTRTTGDPAWTATNRDIGGYILWDGPESQAGNQGRLLSWGSTSARVTEEAVTSSTNVITAEYEGPGLTLGTLRGRWVDLRGEFEPHGGSFAVEPVVDGVTQGSLSVGIAGGFATYGSAIYGVSVYGGVSRKQWFTNLPITAEGRTFVLKAVYTGAERFRLYSYHVGLVNETRSRAFAE